MAPAIADVVTILFMVMSPVSGVLNKTRADPAPFLNPGRASAAERRPLPLPPDADEQAHSSPAHGRLALYLLRPDTYVALADLVERGALSIAIAPSAGSHSACREVRSVFP